jgi:hypothetical protein
MGFPTNSEVVRLTQLLKHTKSYPNVRSIEVVMTGELISHPRIIDFDPNCECTVCNPGVKFFQEETPG